MKRLLTFFGFELKEQKMLFGIKKSSCFLPILTLQNETLFFRLKELKLFTSAFCKKKPKQIFNPEKILFTTSTARNLLCEKSVRISSRCKRYSILNFSNMEQFFLKIIRSFVERKINSVRLVRQNTDRYLSDTLLYPRGFFIILLGFRFIWQKNESWRRLSLPN